jgi:hypothetical protein
MTTEVSPFEFGRLTGRGAPMPPDAAPVYFGYRFQCGCGGTHVLDANIPVPREIPGRNKFVAGCPTDQNVLNFLKVKGLLRIAGLESLCSTRIDTPQQYEEFAKGVIQAQL